MPVRDKPIQSRHNTASHHSGRSAQCLKNSPRTGPGIAIVGLGYVGLPLAVEFGKRYPTLGYDIHASRIAELRQGRDSTLEVEPELLSQATQLGTDNLQDIAACNVYIVTVPTPIDTAKRPDLTPLIRASEAIGSILKPGDTVIYESTVHPGCTEVCVPILERVSGLHFEPRMSPPPASGRGPRVRAIFAPPSPSATARTHQPRRQGPPPHQHPQVTSGSTPDTADFVDAPLQLHHHRRYPQSPSLKVAEAAKVIENTQRDLNIALMNDLAILFNKLGIDTSGRAGPPAPSGTSCRLHIPEGCHHHGVNTCVRLHRRSTVPIPTCRSPEHGSAEHPLTLYAGQQNTNEQMAHSYSHLCGIPTTGLRFFTVYGRGTPDVTLFLFTRDPGWQGDPRVQPWLPQA